MTRIYIILFAVVVSIGTSIARAGTADTTGYATTAAKAERFFANAEWPSACAMYILMLEERPDCSSTYSAAVVANTMAGDTAQAIALVPRAMSHGVAFDSLLSGVRDRCFSIGHGDIYEHFLMDIKGHYPWLARVSDNYLMQYYDFRQNGPMLIRYARLMLDGMPENRRFKRMLARGLMLDGRTTEAVATWTDIVEAHPDDYDTLLDLGNYYDATGDAGRAVHYLTRAEDIRPTPYVARRIADLTPKTNIR